MGLFVQRCLLIVVLACIPLVEAQENYDIHTDARVVAFGDVHGAYQDWVALLGEVGIIDENLDWIAGDTHLVSLGDLIDRGPGSRDVVELMMKLDAQADKAGGAVHLVLGNHEVMVMLGDLRDVSAAEFAAFAGDESPADRERMFADYLRGLPEEEPEISRSAFEQLYPPGYVALRKAYSPRGKLGRWLLQHPLVLKVNDKVYMHGGIASENSELSLTELNNTVRGELREYLDAIDTLAQAGMMPLHVGYGERLAFLNARAEQFVALNPGVKPDWLDAMQVVFDAQKSLVFSEDSPNWYRGTARCHPYSESFNTERFLKRAGARQLVIGHTPSRGKVIERMEGLAIRLDTGMLKSVYGGHAAALVSQGEDNYVHYLGSADKHKPEVEVRSLSRELTGLDDAALEQFMRTAEVVKDEKIPVGITKPRRVTQEQDGLALDSVFKFHDSAKRVRVRHQSAIQHLNESDRYAYDVAAYKLDRMMNLELVPTAVIRTLEDQRGALSIWIHDTISETHRLEQNIEFRSSCKQEDQYRLRFVFDTLIFNDDRNLGNILWDTDTFMMKLIDHSLAFRIKLNRPKQLRSQDLEVSDLLRTKLAGLNLELLMRELSPYLHKKQITTILKRRDFILKKAKTSSPRY